MTIDIGIASEVFQDGESALVCTPGDAPCLETHILKLVEDKQLRQSLTENASRALNRAVVQNKEEYLSQYIESWKSCVT